jgi:two-component system OmpR family response regulator
VASIDGKMIELSARELSLLEVLLPRAGRLVSKEQLFVFIITLKS